MLDDRIDCQNTDTIVCPYCGDEISDDIYEYFNDTDRQEIDCENCKKPFNCYQEMHVKYSTQKIPCKDGESHKFRYKAKWKDEFMYMCEYCDETRFRKEGEEPISV